MGPSASSDVFSARLWVESTGLGRATVAMLPAGELGLLLMLECRFPWSQHALVTFHGRLVTALSPCIQPSVAVGPSEPVVSRRSGMK